MTGTSRTESAAATRRALLDEAAALLDDGGPEAVTLRDVGARAGVSRGAPYRHFADKKTLLTAVAAQGWDSLGERMAGAQERAGSPSEALRAALGDVILLNRTRPHLYRLMFTTPASDPGAVARAAERTCDEFLTIVTAVVGAPDAHRCAALLLTGVHGAAGLESSGLLRTDKWQTSAEELTESLIAAITGS